MTVFVWATGYTRFNYSQRYWVPFCC